MTVSVTYCPVCDDRTVHNYVRRVGGVGARFRCRQHTDVADQIDVGEYELVN